MQIKCTMAKLASEKGHHCPVVLMFSSIVITRSQEAMAMHANLKRTFISDRVDISRTSLPFLATLYKYEYWSANKFVKFDLWNYIFFLLWEGSCKQSLLYVESVFTATTDVLQICHITRVTMSARGSQSTNVVAVYTPRRCFHLDQNRRCSWKLHIFVGSLIS